MEIEMMKAQLREYHWLKEENNNHCRIAATARKQKKPKKRRRGQWSLPKPYCRGCRRYFKSPHVLYVHRRVCQEKIKRECCGDGEQAEKQEEQEAAASPPGERQQQEVAITEAAKEDEKEGAEEIPQDLGTTVEQLEVRPLIFCKDCKLAFGTTREIFEHRRYLDCCRYVVAEGLLASAKEDAEESELSEATDEEYGYDRLYACPTCRAKFISAELLDEHRQRETHWAAPQQQTETGKAIVASGGAEAAADFTFRSLEDGEYECATCLNGVVYHDPDDLIKHQRAVHSAGEQHLYCRYCSHKLSGISEFAEHHRLYHEMLQHCRLCGGGEQHQPIAAMLLQPATTAALPPPKPFCLGCSRRLRLLPLDDCASLHRENLYCEACERAVPTVAHFRFHNCAPTQRRLLAGLSLLVCPLCLEPYNSLRSLYRHIIQHNDLKAFRCEACGKLHDTWRALKAHAIEQHLFSLDLRLPAVSQQILRKNAEDVIRRFVKNGVQLLTN